MLNSKFDINSPEWIDRVFENRNKSYGAYDLRKHYAGNLFRAFAITVFFIAAIIAGVWLLMDKAPASVSINKGGVNVNNTQIKVVGETSTKKADKKTTQPAAAGNDNASAAAPVKIGEVDIKPLPVGGAQGWARFLETNLRYPAEAKEERIQGSVLMSFIVERDGHISNIAIDRPAGHGFDEEALRVLKLSPAWVPARQYGQIVRVKYSLPIIFRIERR